MTPANDNTLAPKPRQRQDALARTGRQSVGPLPVIGHIRAGGEVTYTKAPPARLL